MAEKSYLSKVTVGTTTYDIKDAEARTSIAALGAAALQGVAESISGTGLVDAATVKSYVDGQVGAINSFAYEIVSALPTASASTMYTIYLKAIANASAPDAYEEFITIRTGTEGSYTYSMEKIGDTNIDITGYVPTSRTVAGLALSADLTAEQLQTALGLGAMAYAATASGTGAGETITGIKATGTPSGSISVALTQTDTDATLTKGNFTPEGTVAGTVVPSGTVAIAKDADNGVEITGSVSAPTITVTPATSSIQTIDSVGSQASFTAGTFSQGTLPSYTQGSKAAWSASVSEETLSFSFTANGDDTWSAGTLPSHGDDSFTANSLPTKGTAFTVVTGITSAEASTPTFTGDKFKATFTGNASGDAITATFTGTQATDALVTGVSYKKASVDTDNTAFTGASTEFAVGDITVAGQAVTVSPDAQA